MAKYFASLLLIFVFVSPKSHDLNKLFGDYKKEIETLIIPAYGFDYKSNLGNISSVENLLRFQKFYKKYSKLLGNLERSKLSLNDRINYDHLLYIIKFELKRLALEINFNKESERIPENGLSKLNNHENWYNLYIQLYTGTLSSPEELFRFGETEVKRIQDSIEVIKRKLGFEHMDNAFYTYLKNEKYYLSDTQSIETIYQIKQTDIRRNLYKLFEDTIVPPLNISTWSNATAMMPPAIYRSGENRFDYNFSGKRYSTRAMDWVLNHEGIPGHHYQFYLRNKNNTTKPAFVRNTFYPGTTEGWACYTEYLGKELGQYQTPVDEFGKWEWDLVRSARVVLDVGIHYYAWSKEKALAYWKENIKGQDEIAEREITRVTNWPAQALSYKVGAMKIEAMKAKLKIDKSTIKKFHSAFLLFSSEPIEVIESSIEEVFN